MKGVCLFCLVWLQAKYLHGYKLKQQSTVTQYVTPSMEKKRISYVSYNLVNISHAV